MNLRTILSVTLSALIIVLPACCWKSKRCCGHQETVAAQQVNEQIEEATPSEDKAITKF